MYRTVSVAALAMVLGSGTGWAQFRTVTVQNAPNNPVPTQAQGTTSISGDVNATITGTPAVTISGTPSVNVANTPSVTVSGTPNVIVSNTATSPVLTSQIDEPGRFPYQAVNECGSSNTCAVSFGPLPSHRLVVQHISIFLVMLGGLPGFGYAVAQAPIGGFSAFNIPMTANNTFGAVDQQVQIYVDSPQLLQVTVSSPVGFLATVGVSGYELDCRAAPCATILN